MKSLKKAPEFGVKFISQTWETFHRNLPFAIQRIVISGDAALEVPGSFKQRKLFTKQIGRLTLENCSLKTLFNANGVLVKILLEIFDSPGQWARLIKSKKFWQKLKSKIQAQYLNAKPARRAGK